jgi:hypothetical protein
MRRQQIWNIIRWVATNKNNKILFNKTKIASTQIKQIRLHTLHWANRIAKRLDIKDGHKKHAP